VEGFVSLALSCLIPLYIVAIVLYAVRVLRGPTVPDRVLAVDALGFDLAAFLTILSVLFRAPIMVTTALVLALWIYALDIYVAKYLESKEMGD